MLATAAETARQSLFGRTLQWPQMAERLKAATTQAVSELANDPAAQLVAGDRAFARRDFALAGECYQRAAGLAPGSPEPLQALAAAQVMDGKFEAAAANFQKVLDLVPSDTIAAFNLAVVSARLRRFDRAEAIYRSLAAEHEDFIEARYNLASLYQAQGKLAQARDAWAAVLKQAAKLPPADAAAGYSSLAQVLADLNDSEGAMLAYAEAAKLQSDDPVAWYNFAVAARGAGSLGRARVAARRAAELAPREAAAWALLGEVLLDLHQASDKKEFLDEAVGAWRISIRLDPSQPQILKYLHTYSAEVQPATQK